MALPHSLNARLFYRAALQRFEDAVILRDADRTTGAVYLAGYGVECMLKALVLNSVAKSKQLEVMADFRGRVGHDLERLREMYVVRSGGKIPAPVAHSLATVSFWGVDLRYISGTIKPEESKAFLAAAKSIIAWADGRL